MQPGRRQSFPQIILQTLQLMCALRIAIGWYGNLDENARILGATFGLWELCKNRPGRLLFIIVTIVIISIIIILSSRWIVAQNNRSTMKLDSSKWNRIWSSPYLPNYVVIYLWYILSPILGRKRNGCLGRELRSGIVLLEPSKVPFVLQHWSVQGEISSLCLARNSFSLDSEVFAFVHTWQRRPVSSLSAAKNYLYLSITR